MPKTPLLLALVLLAACAPSPPAPGAPEPVEPRPLPPIPEREGPLRIDVAHPSPNELIPTDSNFIFGQVGTGRASLTIDGTPVPVAPNGAFLAYLPVPRDGVYDLRATAAGDTVTDTLRVRVPSPAEDARPGVRAAIFAGTIRPTGGLVVLEGEEVEVRFRGSPGASARLLLPDGRVVPFRERTLAAGTATGFLEGPAQATTAREYVAAFEALQPLRARDTAVAVPRLAVPPTTAKAAVIELALGADTARVPLPLNLGLLEQPRIAEAAAERLDGNAIAVAALPPGTPYHWFFPRGTLLELTGERGGQYRARMDEDLYVWIGADEVRLLDRRGELNGNVGNVRVLPGRRYLDVRIDTSERLPFHVEAREDELLVSIYGARSRTNWLYLPTTGDLIERIDWEQVSNREYRLRIKLAQPLWGWKTRWDEGGNLVVGVRRPPAIDPDDPFEGIAIAVDAGHPPGGAIGPTGFTEAEANLLIANRLIPMLRERGARVIVTRPDTAAVGLYEREIQAEQEGADLFVSVHNNAFGPGVNPFENAGTSVLYNRPQSVDLARDLQQALLAEFGLRDLGIIHADRALVRITSMPSALTETMFLMIPQQEAALKDPEVHERIARAHVRALEDFLRARARARER